jgi:hypothetical protein
MRGLTSKDRRGKGSPKVRVGQISTASHQTSIVVGAKSKQTTTFEQVILGSSNVVVPILSVPTTFERALCLSFASLH